MKKANIFTSSIFQYLVIAFMLLYLQPGIWGQKNLKYKDVYTVVSEKSKEEAYSLLLVFQKQEPYFANTYFQLGLIAQYWSKDYDALTNLRDVEFFIYNTGLYFGLAKSKIDSKEIRKNDKYYLNVERLGKFEKLEAEEVNAYIDEQLAANIEYKKNVYIVTDLFNASIINYNRCINIFKEINTKNNKIKDIYLTAGSSFSNQLNELEKSFDSTIYYIQNYQTALKNYPIKDYNQKYKLLPIETYRLHGLTSSDFLKNEIPIWDYGTWVKNVKQILNGDIKQLRQAIDNADNLLNKNINFLLETKEYKPDFELAKIDERLKYKIGKYDHKSIMLDLFNYKESKINFLSDFKNPINDIEDTNAEFTLLQKARFYEELINKKKVCDSLNQNFISNLTTYELQKYSDFFTNNYGGESGLKNYSNNEKSLLKSTLDKSFDNFKTYLIKTSKISDNQINIPYKNQTIKLSKSHIEFEKAVQNEYYTSDFFKTNSGDYYITGYTSQKNSEIQGFIALSNKLDGIKWLKLIQLNKQGNSIGSFIRAKEQGCEVLFNLIENGLTTNQIISFDESGKQKDKFELNINGFPRYFSYDDINQQYLIALKGNLPNAYDCLNDELTINQIDANSKETNWQKKLNLKGQIVDIIKMNQDLFLISNFTEYSTDSTSVKSSAGSEPTSTNVIIIVLDENGNVKKESPILQNKPYFVAKSIKISSNAINLVGIKSNLADLSDTNEAQYGDFLYLLINAKAQSYYDNWK